MKKPSFIINEIIKDSGLSISEFARQLCVERQTFQDILSEKRKKIPSDVIEKIKDKWGYSSLWLITGEGEKFAKTDGLTEPAGGYVVIPAASLDRLMAKLESMDLEIKAIKRAVAA